MNSTFICAHTHNNMYPPTHIWTNKHHRPLPSVLKFFSFFSLQFLKEGFFLLPACFCCVSSLLSLPVSILLLLLLMVHLPPFLDPRIFMHMPFPISHQSHGVENPLDGAANRCHHLFFRMWSVPWTSTPRSHSLLKLTSASSVTSSRRYAALPLQCSPWIHRWISHLGPTERSLMIASKRHRSRC